VTKVVGENAGLRGADVKVGTTQVTALPGPGGAGRRARPMAFSGSRLKYFQQAAQDAYSGGEVSGRPRSASRRARSA
jgi:hypothetical protein